MWLLHSPLQQPHGMYHMYTLYQEGACDCYSVAHGAVVFQPREFFPTSGPLDLPVRHRSLSYLAAHRPEFETVGISVLITRLNAL